MVRLVQVIRTVSGCRLARAGREPSGSRLLRDSSRGRHPVMRGGLRDRRPALPASSVSDSADAAAAASRSPAASSGGVSTSSCRIASSCACAACDGALHVRARRRSPAGSPRARVAATTACSSSRRARLARTRDRERGRRSSRRPSRRRRAWRRAARATRERDAFARGDLGRKRAPSTPVGAELEVRRARARERAGAEQRAAQVGAAAARAADDALRRPLERRAARRERRRPRAARSAARPSTSTCSWYRVARRMRAAGTCGSPSERRRRAGSANARRAAAGAREVEVDGELAVAAQVPRAGGVEERRELREAAAAAARRDRRELVAQVVRERHALEREQAPLVLDAERRRNEPIPPADDDAVARDERREAVARAERARRAGRARAGRRARRARRR